MINRAAITQWNSHVPWNNNAQVEQDLIISRALVPFSVTSSLHHNWLSEVEQRSINYTSPLSRDIVRT